jgi:hypothetical protein
MIAAARARGFSPADDNEADAIAIPALGAGDPRGPAMRRFPRGYGGERRNPEQVKRDGWKEQRVFAVSLDDQRLTWPERELVRQLGERLYGARPTQREVRK